MRRGNILSGGAFTAALLSLGAFMAVLLALGAILYVVLSGGMERDVDDQLVEEAQLFLQIYDRYGQQALVDAIAQMETPAVAGRRVAGLFDTGGRRLAGNLDTLPLSEGWMTLEFDQLLPRPNGLYRLHAGKISAPGPALTLVVGYNVRVLQQTEWRLLYALLIAGAAVTVASVTAGYAVSRRMFGKLETMSETLETVSRGDMAARIPVSPLDDQIDRIARRINAHISRLAVLSDITRNTVNTIAHDLRAPLGRISVEVQQAMVETADDAGQLGRLETVLAELEGVTGAFDAIVRISRIRASAGEAGFSLVCVPELLAEMQETFAPILEDAGQRLVCDPASCQGLVVFGDAPMLRQALANLVQNAGRHCPAGTTVMLDAIEEGEGTVTLRVRDDGSGIPADLRADVLLPFHRGEGGRPVIGTGLGLALVSAIAVRHDASLTLSDNNPGLAVSIRFPPRSKINIL